MSFVESLGLDIVKNEKDMLRAMRDAAERWFNELTQPFLPILSGDISSPIPSVEDRRRLAKLANEMMCAELLINNGDALENKLAEIEKSSGIPLFSGRRELKERVVECLNSGVFLKKIAYGAIKRSETASEYREAVVEARKKWLSFKSAREALVAQINSQLAKIG